MDVSRTEETHALAEKVIKLALDKGLYIGVAESLTGGKAAAALTSVSGASGAFAGGIVSYLPRVKHAVLGVEQWIIDTPEIGVVSDECAREMAEGARRVLNVDVALSFTGIAGPTGAEPGKPVGTVYMGISSKRGSRTHRYQFSGNRDEVREASVQSGLEMLYKEIMELPEADNE